MLVETLNVIPGVDVSKLANQFGNWANNETIARYVGCSFMDLHDDVDYGVTPEQPYFWIRPVYWDPAAYLVVSDDNVFQIIERTDRVIQFDATKQHGLIPWLVALELIERQDDQGPMYQEFEFWCRDHLGLPKLIWEWINLV